MLLPFPLILMQIFQHMVRKMIIFRIQSRIAIAALQFFAVT